MSKVVAKAECDLNNALASTVPTRGSAAGRCAAPAVSINRLRQTLLAGSAFTGAFALLMAANPQSALAGCAVTVAPNTVACGNTTTTDTTNTQTPAAASTDRVQLFNAGGGVTGQVNSGATVNGFGLVITNTQTGTNGDINFTNAGTVTVTTGAPNTGGFDGALVLNSGGTINYAGNGSVIGTGFTTFGLVLSAGADANIGTSAVPITATFVGGPSQAIFVGAGGNANVFLSGGSLTGSAGSALQVTSGGNVFIRTTNNTTMTEGASGNGIVVSANGTVTISTDANMGTSGATLGDGIQAKTTGAGAVNITQTGGAIFADHIGIHGTATTGAMTVTVGGTITAAGAGSTGVRLDGGVGNLLTVQSGKAVAGETGLALATGTTTLDLQGSITGTGGTAINLASGTLTIGGSSAFGTLTGGIVDNGTLQFNRSDTITLSNTISGSGVVQQNGSGTTVLTATESYTGATTVNAGTLRVDGSIASSVLTTVNSGGTLAGIGTVGNLTVNGGGIFAPGPAAAPGAMTVSGSLAFQSGALYVVQVNPSTASIANVSGSATLTGGSVQTAFSAGSYVPRSYTILHTTGGLGHTTFSGVSGNVPVNFTESLSYTATDVILNLTAALGVGIGLNQNQQNVATAVNNVFNNSGALPANFLSLFGLTGGNLANALTLLSGEPATGAQQGAFQLMNQFLGIMLDPFVDGRGGLLPDGIAPAHANVMKAPAYKAPPFEQRWTVWGSAYGGYNRTGGDPAVVGSHDLTARAAGFAAGTDYRVAPGTVLGFALAGGATNWGLAQGLGGGKSDAFQAGVYGTTRSGPAYLAASLAFTNYWMSTDRFAVAGDHLTANFNAQSIGARLESGYRIGSPTGAVTPYAAVQAQAFRTPTYSETDVNAGGFGLTYNNRSATDTRSELGARFDHVVAVDPTAALALRARLAWAHDWITDPALAAVFQALPGASFIVNGATPVKNSALASAGAELRLANGVTLLGKFDGEFANRSSTYGGTGTVRVAW
jgi:uncharacterized protein with beta-barrel porin domain